MGFHGLGTCTACSARVRHPLVQGARVSCCSHYCSPTAKCMAGSRAPRLSYFCAPQPQRVRDHADRRQRHRGRGHDRRQQQAEAADRARRRRAGCRPRCRQSESNRFCRMLRMVACDSVLARTMPIRSPLSSVMPALSIATSVPVPIAMPTVAAARAGASLTPSPAMATTRPSLHEPLHDRDLVLGEHLGHHLVDAELAGRPPRPSSCRRRSASRCGCRPP